MLRRWITHSLLFIALSVPFAAIAEQSYIVELLIFSRPAAAEKQGFLRTEQNLPLLSGARELSYGAGSFQLLDSSGLRLRQEAERLRNSGFKVIQHIAWRQPALEPTRAEAVRVMTEGGNVLDGTVRLSVSRYLQLETDLAYFNPSRDSSWADGSAAGPKHFRLTESRWMKSKELNYFDHPTFGVIALVIPN